MRKQRTISNSAKLNWETESLRLTAFPRFPERARDCGSWKAIVGREPDTRQERPSDQVVVEGGEFEDGWLTLEISPARIDWRFTMKAAENMPPSGMPVFGPFQETRDTFLLLMKRWLKTVSPLNRLAFGAVLLLPVTDRAIGYDTLNQLLPSVEIDSHGTSDFNYRINRKRPSQLEIKNLQINRLSNWSVLSVRTAQVQLEPGRSRVFETQDPLYACRLELDINSAPEFAKGLPKKRFPMLFHELIDFATEISEEGDVR